MHIHSAVSMYEKHLYVIYLPISFMTVIESKEKYLLEKIKQSSKLLIVVLATEFVFTCILIIYLMEILEANKYLGPWL